MLKQTLVLLAISAVLVASTEVLNCNPSSGNYYPTQCSFMPVVGTTYSKDIVIKTPSKSAVLVDIMLVYDLSGSFGDDLVKLRAMAGSLFPSIRNQYPHSWFGLGSFKDMPVYSSSSDYAYSRHAPLSSSYSGILSSLNSVYASGGGDGPESQLWALLIAAKRTNWRSGAGRRVIILSTDHAYHKAGDGKFPHYNTNNGDGHYDNAGTPGEDYPSVSQVKSALRSANAVPIFLVTSSYMSTYRGLVSSFGMGTVVQLSPDSSNLENAILSGLTNIGATVKIEKVSDPSNMGVKIDSPTVYTNVPPLTTKTFTVYIKKPSASTPNADIVYNVPGFGRTTFSVAANEAPVASFYGSVSTQEDTSVIITMGGSDPDDAANTLRWIITGEMPSSEGRLVWYPSYESVSVPSTGNSGVNTVKFYPATNFYTTSYIYFEFKIVDPAGATSNTVRVPITVTSVNDAPKARSKTYYCNEDSNALLTLTGTDEEQGTTTKTQILSLPSNGALRQYSGSTITSMNTMLTDSASRARFYPSSGWCGTSSFRYRVFDNQDASSSAATVTLQVACTNDNPIAYSRSFSTNEDVAFTEKMSASDADGDSLTYAIATSPSHGTLSGLSGSSFKYNPHSQYSGTDSFTFVARDTSSAASNTATVTIYVIAVNDRPTAQTASFSTPEDTQLSQSLASKVSDPDSSTLTVSRVTGPYHGILTLYTTGSFTYSPVSNYVGSDSFTFRAFDGTLYSNTATCSISVTEVNDPPVVVMSSPVSVYEDELTLITLGASDIDTSTSSISAKLTVLPSKGRFLMADKSTVVTTATTIPHPRQIYYDFTPETIASDVPSYTTFTYRVYDGSRYSATKTITLDAFNNFNPPTTSHSPSPAQCNEDSNGFAITLSGSSSTGLKMVSAHVSFSSMTGKLYQCAGTSCDTCTGPGTQINSGTTSITMQCSDQSSYKLWYKNDVSNWYGTTDAFTYVLTDTDGQASVTKTVPVTVNNINDDPVAMDTGVITMAEDATKTFTLSGYDIDSSSLTYSLRTIPSASLGSYYDGPGTTTPISSVPHNIADVQSRLTFKPAANQHSSPSTAAYVTNTFRLTDSNGAYDQATITIRVLPVNDAPVANAQTVSAVEDTDLPITLSGSDVDGNPITSSIAMGPSHGSLYRWATGDSRGAVIYSDGVFTNNMDSLKLIYVPDANYEGTDSFTFRMKDSDDVYGSPATVTVNVAAVNDPPVASASSSVTADEDTPIYISLTATDTEDSNSQLVFKITSHTSPTKGDLFKGNTTDASFKITTLPFTLGNGNNVVTYLPALNQFGGSEATPFDSFTFSVTDTGGSIDSKSVDMIVMAKNDPPTANNVAVTGTEDEPVTIALTVSDIDADVLGTQLVSKPGKGSIYQWLSGDSLGEKLADSTRIIKAEIANKKVMFVPAANEYASPYTSFTYAAMDTKGAISNVATVSISVRPVNDVPIVVGPDNPTTLFEDAVGLLQFQCVDPDGGDKCVYTITTLPTCLSPANPDEPKCFFRQTDGTDINSVPVNITSDLGMVSFRGGYNVYKNNYASFTVVAYDDVGAQSTPFVQNINVAFANDAPRVLPQSSTITILEDTHQIIYIRGTDSDGDTVTGYISKFPANRQFKLFQYDSSKPGNAGVEITTENTHLTDSGGRVVYLPNSNVEGGGPSFEFTYQVFDGHLLSADSMTARVVVLPINDPPVISVPKDQLHKHVPAGTLTSFNGIVISDADSGIRPIKVTITTTGGSFNVSVNDHSDVKMTQSANGKGMSYVLLGPVASINEVCKVMGFISSVDGNFTVTITADDLGAYGIDGPKTATVSMKVRVAPLPKYIPERSDPLGAILGSSVGGAAAILGGFKAFQHLSRGSKTENMDEMGPEEGVQENPLYSQDTTAGVNPLFEAAEDSAI